MAVTKTSGRSYGSCNLRAPKPEILAWVAFIPYNPQKDAGILKVIGKSFEYSISFQPA